MSTIPELLAKIKELETELQQTKKQKRYGLVWEDKPEDVVERCKQELPVLEEDISRRIDASEDDLTHILIEWDNYHALSVLAYTHEKKVDVIYIDPPYNTGNKDFSYNDSFVDKEDSFRHSKWLSFMGSRLNVAKWLLKEDWAIFISIDDHEFTQLKCLCDDIFGIDNFVDCISWDKKSSAKGVPPKNMIVNVHEYILVYQKSDQFSFIWEPRDIGWFANPDNDIRWPWRNTNIKSTVKNKEDVFPVVDPNTGNIFTDTWAFSQTELQRLIDENYLIFPKNKNGQVRRKEFFHEFKNQNTPIKSSWWLFDNQSNTEMLKNMLNGAVFLNPKPLKLLQYLLKIVLRPNSIILDFFAWSGTTWHAVLELNREDGGKRQVILCTNNENKIAEEVTYPRMRNVISGYADVVGIPANLRYYTTPFITVDKSIDDLRGKFMGRCTEMLCIRESIFSPVDASWSSEYFQVFENMTQTLVIMYDPYEDIERLRSYAEWHDGQIVVYIFSMSPEMWEEELAYLGDRIRIETIPDEILETYKKIFGF